eukprot:403347919
MNNDKNQLTNPNSITSNQVSQLKPFLSQSSFPSHQEPYGSIKDKKVNPDLQAERDNCDFDQLELTKILYGNHYDKHKVFQKIIRDTPQIQGDPKYYDMNRQEMMIHSMKVIKAAYLSPLTEVEKDYVFDSSENLAEYLQGQVPFALSFSMFNLVVTNLSTPEQCQKWRSLLTTYRIMGCYAQTELGHGSNVAALETTATLDKTTDEFVINSPSITSTKWWPGELGKFSNHAAVAARLIIDGNDFGVQFFIVPIRNPDTHEPLPNIEVGDIGPKIGYLSKDNGFIIFKNVRIPRENMMMKYCRVKQNGELELDGDPRLLYGVMLGIRVWIMNASWKYLGQATLISGRYSAVRRQFANIDGEKKLERKLLDYQSHQFKIIPALASVIVQNIAKNHINDIYQAFINDLKNGSDNFKPLKVIHHLISGLKANYTQNTFESISRLRESCGGAGYLSSSGLPQLVQEYSAQVTYEGDNTVMLQQSARYILDGVSKNKEYKEDAIVYLNNLKDQFKQLPVINAFNDLSTLKAVEDALRVRSAYYIHQAINLGLVQHKGKEKKTILLHEVYQVDQITLANFHIYYYSVWSTRQYLEKNAGNIKNQNLKKHLENLVMVYGLMELFRDSAILYSCGYFNSGHRDMVLETLKAKIKEVRPYAIPIMESFDFDDWYLTSSIGNSYGDISEDILNQARNSKLNQSELAPGFKEHILPILNRPKL